jgi:DNA-binding transcriptional LysR family regulator
MTSPLRVSLNALRAFEATARLRSFSAAAEELSVTHGAVSRHIRMLEDSVGLPLLKRTAQGAVPTGEGQRLADGLSTAFSLIQSSVEQLKPGPMTLACSESIMMYWLLPRLNRFKDAHPEVELRFNMSHGPLDFARDNVSVAIRLSSIEAPKDVVRADVAPEWVGPVCSPQYLRQKRIEAVEDLARATDGFSHAAERLGRLGSLQRSAGNGTARRRGFRPLLHADSGGPLRPGTCQRAAHAGA